MLARCPQMGDAVGQNVDARIKFQSWLSRLSFSGLGVGNPSHPLQHIPKPAIHQVLERRGDQINENVLCAQSCCQREDKPGDHAMETAPKETQLGPNLMYKLRIRSRTANLCIVVCLSILAIDDPTEQSLLSVPCKPCPGL